MKKEIKKSLLYYGGSYDWVKNDLNSLVKEAEKILEDGITKYADRAAYLVIDKRF